MNNVIYNKGSESIDKSKCTSSSLEYSSAYHYDYNDASDQRSG